jgi:hypothetical protein
VSFLEASVKCWKWRRYGLLSCKWLMVKLLRFLEGLNREKMSGMVTLWAKSVGGAIVV